MYSKHGVHVSVVESARQPEAISKRHDPTIVPNPISRDWPRLDFCLVLLNEVIQTVSMVAYRGLYNAADRLWVL